MENFATSTEQIPPVAWQRSHREIIQDLCLATTLAQKLIHGFFTQSIPFPNKLRAFSKGLSVRELRTPERASTEGKIGWELAVDF